MSISQIVTWLINPAYSEPATAKVQKAKEAEIDDAEEYVIISADKDLEPLPWDDSPEKPADLEKVCGI